MDREDDSQKSPSFDVDDEKYVSGLSTVVVASIQEAKDRISQIERIFCSKLYPNFLSKTKALKNFYSESIKSLEGKWKEKENELLLQIEKMRVENQRLLEENGSLKVVEAKAKAPFELELMAKQRKIEELEREIRRKCDEVDEGLVLQKNLVELVQAKGSLVLEKEKQLKENKEKTKGLLMKVKKLEKEVEVLQEELKRKNEKMNKETEFQKLFANNVELITGIANSEMERNRPLAQIGELEKNVAGIRMELGVKIQEAEQRVELHKQLLQQMDLKISESLENKKRLDGCEKDKKRLLLDNVKFLEEKISQPYKVSSATVEFSNGMTSCQKLLKQIESITSEQQAEKRKRVQITEAYRRPRSQHSFLREMVGLTMENMIQNIKGKDEGDLYKHKSPIRAPGYENKPSDIVVTVCGTNKMKKDMLDDDKGATLSPPSTFHHIPYCPPTSTKSASVSGTKRPASSWRQTRSHQSRAGPKLHDDFLDTPLEDIRANLNKTPNKEELLGSIQKDISMDTSDDETQDLNAQSSPQNKQSSVLLGRNKSLNYIEPVRKKADCEDLKGVECEQCKKFYDAVLPNGDSQSPHSRKWSLRCEHHDGVSRHRYRYVPPMTPEGFWNIGFESET